ncbi:putative alpha-glucosidase [Naematelia encephala]|uniref:Putative alpha-glucosidase n=1 Tax=Naematelia encephala TaxID=71784 RepID=A0A1Y2B930_9TREE|nr:putative alpha-glucosidase [Naematelia encephala]
MPVRTDVNGHGSVDPNWWRQSVVYQIYPRSFADSNGDGLGDIQGITSKVPYLKQLGVDAVWLSPFYPSALKDGGYDVADYRNVDPKLGTLRDFDEMMAAFKGVGIKVIVDIVPNHTSDDHIWFQEALKSLKGSAARAKYIFRDGLGPNKDQPPSDWNCLFGGLAWEPVGDGQYYLHLFDTSQPDLDWSHPDVRESFLDTLRFWGDRGVSGFRVDVAHGMAKDMDSPLPDQKTLDAIHVRILQNGAEKDSHPFWDREEVLEIFKSWRTVFNEYDPPLMAVAEAWVAPDRKHYYASPEGLGQCFSFDMLMANYTPESFRSTIDHSLKIAKPSGSSTTWVFSNHDVVRHPTRYGLPGSWKSGDQVAFPAFTRDYLLSQGKEPKCDHELGLKRAKAATLMMLALPGSAYLYQGEELGLPEVVEIKPEERQDPTFFRHNGTEIGRDGCRVPLPWTLSGPNFGFGSGKPAHLPQPEYFGGLSVQAQDDVPDSTLNLYRKALAARRSLQSDEQLEWVNESGDVLHFKRPGGWEVVMNFGKESVQVPQGDIIVASDKLVDGKIAENVTVWVKT